MSDIKYNIGDCVKIKKNILPPITWITPAEERPEIVEGVIFDYDDDETYKIFVKYPIFDFNTRSALVTVDKANIMEKIPFKSSFPVNYWEKSPITPLLTKMLTRDSKITKEFLHHHDNLGRFLESPYIKSETLDHLAKLAHIYVHMEEDGRDLFATSVGRPSRDILKTFLDHLHKDIIMQYVLYTNTHDFYDDKETEKKVMEDFHKLTNEYKNVIEIKKGKKDGRKSRRSTKSKRSRRSRKTRRSRR